MPATAKGAKASKPPAEGVKVVQTGWSPGCQTASLALTLSQESRFFLSKTCMKLSTQTKRESLWSLEIWKSSPRLTSHNSDSSHAWVFSLPMFLCFNFSFPPVNCKHIYEDLIFRKHLPPDSLQLNLQMLSLSDYQAINIKEVNICTLQPLPFSLCDSAAHSFPRDWLIHKTGILNSTMCNSFLQSSKITNTQF